MKRILSMTLIMILVLSLTSCGGTTALEGKGKKIAVFYYSFEDSFLSDVRVNLNDELTSLRVDYDNYDSENSQEKQNSQIDEAIKGGANLLLVNIVSGGDKEAAEAIIKKAGNVPVVFFNRSVERMEETDSLFDQYKDVGFVGSQPGRAGYAQGELIGDYLAHNYDSLDRNHDGKISYVMLKGSENSPECDYRTQYSVESANAILKKWGRSELEYFNPDIKEKYQVDPDNMWSEKAAREIMKNNLTRYNDNNKNMIELVICNNDAMAVGAVSALSEVGYNKGTRARTIPVFGIDATETAQALIREGVMAGTKRQSSKGLAEALGAVSDGILTGKKTAEAISEALSLNSIFFVEKEHTNKLLMTYSAYP